MIIKKLLARQARWAEYLLQYYFKLMYRAGKSNKQANALSRKLKETKAQSKLMADY
jgi:hypothetical protein